MIERVLIILLIIILALIVVNIIITSTYNKAQYGGMSPIDWSNDIPIFITPISSYEKVQVFSLDDIFNTPIETAPIIDTPITDTPITDTIIETVPITDTPIETVPIEVKEQTEEEIYQHLKTALLTIVESEEFIKDNLRIKKGQKNHYEIYDIPPLTGNLYFLEIEKKDNSLMLEFLGKSRSFSGSTLMEFIYTISGMWQVDNIKLQDSSTIKYTFELYNGEDIQISFFLYCFYILAYGKSWYNTLGFYCDEYMLELDNNSLWISKRYDEFVDRMIDNFLEEFIFVNHILRLTIDISGIKEFKASYRVILDDYSNFYNDKNILFKIFKDKIVTFFSIQELISKMSKEVFTDALPRLNKDIFTTDNDGIQIIIRQLFANLFTIVLSYHDDIISSEIKICDFLQLYIKL